jgi:hypothetical protein
VATELARNRIAWTYTDDVGKDWRVAAQKAMTDQAKLGGAAALGSVPPKPGNLKMRRTTVSKAGVGSRTVPIYTTDAALLADGATVNANFGMTSDTFEWGGAIIAERRPRGSVTKQAT